MRAHQPRFTLKPTLLAILLAFPGQQALAATCNWNQATGNWGTAGNWSCGVVPGVTDTASIGGGQSSTVTGGQGPTNVSNAGTVSISDNSSLVLLGTNVNSGTVNLNSAGNVTDLRVSGALAMNGSGVVSLSNVTNNRIVAHTGAGDVLSIGSGQTVQGAGQIGAGGALGLVNAGTVVANLSNGITLNAQGGVTNNNVLRGDGATLLIQNTTVNQGASGVLDAINNGVVRLSGVGITSGTLTTSAGSAIATAGGTTSSVSGVTNNGTLNIIDNSTLTLNGTLTNNGSVNMLSVGNTTTISVTGAQTIDGTGTINLSNTLSNHILGAGATLTLGSGQTLQGSGIIGAGSTGFALVNNGTLIATQPSPLLVNALGGVTNTGTMRADGGTLQLQTTMNSGGGAIEARNGSQVQLLNGAVINNANFSASGANSLITTVGGSTVTLGGGTIAGPMTINDNSNLVLAANATYNGTLSLTSVGNVTSLQIDGTRSLTGAATVQLSNTTANQIRGRNASGDSLVIDSGITVQGSGIIGAGSAGFALTNSGTLIATQSQPLLVNALGGVTNTGTLRADGGTLQLQTTVESGGGAIEALNGSQVQLLNGAVINNANFSASGTNSLITTVGGSTVTLGGGTIAGPMTIADNSNLVLAADATYNGTLSLASVGNVTSLQIDGARSLTGTATVQMLNTTANQIKGRNASGDSLVINSGITVQGAGIIGGNNLSLVNNGSLIATQPGGITLSSVGTVTNNNVIQGDGAVFTIAGTNLSQGAAGVLNAVNNGIVRLTGNSTITGGAVTTGSGGQIATLSGNTAGISGVTNTGTLNIVDNSALLLNGTLTNNGVVNLQSAGNSTDLRTTGNRLIDGTGTINLSNVAANRLVAAVAGNSLTLGSGQTLQGAGQIGAGGQLNFTNNGTVIGNLSTALTISSTGTVTNNKTVRADSGPVTISGTNVVQGAAGVLDAINGGVVRLIGNSTITGGTFTTGNGGQIATLSGNTAGISGVTNTGTLNIVDNSSLLLNGTLTNNGVVNLQSAGNSTDLRTTGNRLIDGTGTINLSNAAQNRIVAATAGDSLTLGSGQTLQGAGQIGAGGQLNFTNNGTVIGNLPNAILISSTGTVTNNKTVRADDGTVTISGTNFGQGALGVIDAVNTGIVNVSGGSTITGGTLTTASGGQIRTTSGQVATIANVANNGDFNVVDNSTLVLSGTVTNNGTLDLNSAGNTTTVQVAGNVTLAGTGATTLGNSLQNRIVATGAGDHQLTNGAGHTIQGSGSIGGGSAMTIVNQGTITANQVNALNIQVAAGQTVQNQLGGLMQATGGRTLDLNSVIANNGTIAANGGVVNANAGFTGTGIASTGGTGRLNLGAASTVGTLINDGSAANALSLGANNITVSGDYTNTNAGTGNTFNRRANVTGTGQILAGGDAAQAITGTAVTNGNTANATLTLGNVRVGSTTFDYQVANTGGTGPALRGAIQTNVNGGNLTDTRLSGAGVTASNYNAGAPGSNTGNLGVTFTAASAGALAPLTGQVLNLRSNFDNIADQKLNIVLAGGAAAYNAAVGSAASPVQVANQRIGGSNTATVAVTNTNISPAGFQEDLNASVSGQTGAATGSGSIIGRLAGASSGGGAISASVNTGSAGAKTGTITLNYETAGKVNGVSNGLGTASVGSQDVTVNGNVYQVAQPTALPASINLGNFRAGTAQSQTVTLTNTNISPAGFQEGLNASIGTISGAATGSGALNNVAAGASGTLQIGVTGVAGDNTGSVQVQLATNGTGTSGLGNDNLGGAQTINVSGTGYRLAQANANAISPINFGNVLANSIQTRTLTISNTATADGFSEALNAAFGNIGGANAASFTTKGVINGLLAGGNDNTSMVVTLNTSATGTKTANVQILLDSNGTAIGNGLGITALPTQTVNLDGVITGVVGNLASAGLSPTTVNFGKFREGAANQTQQLTVSNLTQGPGEGLNASFGAANGSASNNGGSITSLATGSSNNTSMSVTLGGLATAGGKTGSQVLNFVSDGTFNNNTPTNLPSQTVNLSAEVYRLATASVTTPINLAARRVGDAAATGVLTLTNTAANDGFSEGLRGTIGAAPAGFSVTGPANTGLIAAGGNTTRTVTLDTATAGVFGGSIAVALASDGAGTSGFAEVALRGQSAVVSGNVYAPAVAQLNTPNVNFGIVRVGDVVATQNVSVTNAATPTALNDTMKANVGAVTGPFSGSGSASGIGASASNAPGTLTLGLATGAAGLFNGTASIGFTSQNPEMADFGLGSQLVNLSAQVNNLANADFDKLSGLGTFSQTDSDDYKLDFGDVSIGALLRSILQLDNDVSVSDPADLLSGGFSFTKPLPLGFAYSGWNSFTGLDAGGAIGGLTIDFSALTAGQYRDEVIFGGFSTNGSGPDLAQSRRLTILANVIDGGGTVPEPGSLALLLAAAVAGAIARRRQALARESRVQA